MVKYLGSGQNDADNFYRDDHFANYARGTSFSISFNPFLSLQTTSYGSELTQLLETGPWSMRDMSHIWLPPSGSPSPQTGQVTWLGNIGSPKHGPLHQSWRRSSASCLLGTFKKTYFCFKSSRERGKAWVLAICWAQAQFGCWLFRGPWSPLGILFL